MILWLFFFKLIEKEDSDEKEEERLRKIRQEKSDRKRYMKYKEIVEEELVPKATGR
jgi:hypothetical protein